MRYDFAEFEIKWQQKWTESNIFAVKPDSSKPKYYCLEMFPYPSGNIHMGHVRNYSIGDVLARHKIMRGFNVLHPIGWDSFGLPAENAAKENNTHPAIWTVNNIKSMKKQLQKFGLSFDWSAEISTCDPSYYRWEQEFFIELWEKKLAYKKKANVNWCESCQTVLANEQVEDGKCWRCGEEVLKKELEQWFIKITDYADELVDSTYDMPGWPEKVLTMQRNWIGRSEGAEVDFKIDGWDESITVFTTRPDTIYGATFMLLAPQHKYVKMLLEKSNKWAEAKSFIDEIIAEQAEAEKNPKISIDEKEKRGFFTGAYATNPLTSQKMPIYIANYILMGYGTGAVMAVAAHDERDFDFATKYDLPIVQVIASKEAPEGKALGEVFSGDGKLVNSGEFTGMDNEAAKGAIVDKLVSIGVGRVAKTYKLRDWGVSRQRYWGAPVPFIHCAKCGIVPVPKDELPVLLPKDVDFKYHGNPLDKVDDFINVKCPKCGEMAKRDTDTMDTFMESSWYFLRYCSVDYDKGMFDPEAVKYWMPVDQYIGGIEHAVMHLLYSRFITKVLRDFGRLDFSEPFTNLLTQGMVCKETYKCPVHNWVYPEEVKDGKCVHCESEIVVGRTEKMSKSKKNVVDPDDLVSLYGADTLRLFSLFAAPPERESEWSDSGVEGCYRFINRLYRLVISHIELLKGSLSEVNAPQGGATDSVIRVTHQTIKKITQDMDRMQFNTAIASLMECVNDLYLLQNELKSDADKGAFKGALKTLLLLAAPFVPHVAEELWSVSGEDRFISLEEWPGYKDEYTIESEITIAVQVNGKVRDEVNIARDSEKEYVFEIVLASEKVQTHIKGKEIVKKIYVPNKLVSLVVK